VSLLDTRCSSPIQENAPPGPSPPFLLVGQVCSDLHGTLSLTVLSPVCLVWWHFLCSLLVDPLMIGERLSLTSPCTSFQGLTAGGRNGLLWELLSALITKLWRWKNCNPVLGRLRLEDWKFKVSLGYIRRPISINKTKRHTFCKTYIPYILGSMKIYLHFSLV
jgi:hypothetical protein